MGIGVLRFVPRWILKTVSFVMRFLYKVSRQPGKPPEDLDKMCDRTLDKIKNVNSFFKKLGQATKRD